MESDIHRHQLFCIAIYHLPLYILPFFLTLQTENGRNKNKIEEQDNDNIYVYSEYPDNDNPSGYADKHNLDDSGSNYSQVGNNDVDLSEDHYRESSDSFGSSPFFLCLKCFSVLLRVGNR